MSEKTMTAVAPTARPVRYPTLRRAFAERQVRVGLFITLAVVALALFGPFFAPHEHTALVGPVYGGPEPGAPLGYDFIGHDMLSRVLSGGWSVVWMSLAVSAIALALGTILGMAAGYSRRWLDQFIVWWTDVFHAFPNLILILLVVSMLGRQPWLIVLTAAVAFVPGVIRLVRGLTIGVVNQEFVEAAEMIGIPRRQVLLQEILPNIVTPLLVHLGTMLSWAVGILSGLAFLGYGIAPPAADWGLMINENRPGLQIQPWALFAPMLMLVLFALGTNLLAEGVGRVTARIEEK